MQYIIVNDYDYIQGGATKVAIQTANVLYDKGYNVIFFCGVSNPLKSILNKKIKVISCNQQDFLNQNIIKGALKGLNNREVYKKFNAVLNQINDDIIVHIHGWTKVLSSSFIRGIKKRSNVKVVLTLHDFFTVCPNGGFFNYKKNTICKKKPMSISCLCSNCDSRNYLIKLYRVNRTFYQNKINKFLKNIDLFISISQLQYDILSPFLNKEKIELVYNPTSIPKKRNERIIAEASNQYLFVGRVTKDKGIDLLCEYFSHSNEILNIVGTGELENELKQKYKDFSNIIFNGWKTQDEVYEYMMYSRAIFIPSVYYEGAPLAVFEALSFGLPIAVSNLCAGKNFVDANSGCLFNPYNKDEFFNILKNFKNDDFISKMSEYSFKKYWDNPFDEHRYINSLINAYSKIITKKGELYGY